MKMAVFWVVAPCSHQEAAGISETSANFYQTTRRNNPEVYRRFRDTFCLRHQAASTSETSVKFYQATRRNNPEDSKRSRFVSDIPKYLSFHIRRIY
jgi:hypothetical protein